MAYLLDSLHARAGNLLERLDRLREDEQLKELKLDLQFPQIVVVGQESSGKSTVLERLAMREFFPRHAGLCTRLPIELTMRRMTRAEMMSHCETNKHPFSDNVATIRVFLERRDGTRAGSKMVFSPPEAGSLIRDMMAKVLTARNGKNYGVSDDVLHIEVHSCVVPNLTLVDLPGIVSADRASEPTGIMRATRSLVEKYLRKEHTLVLVVCPAYERIANNQGVQMVQEFGKTARAVGVLTMADMCNYPGTDRFWELKQRLEGTANDCVHLKRGWIAVKNRDNRQQGTDTTPLAAAAAAEEGWFDKNLPGYRQSGKACNDSLMVATADMLCDYVSETWVPQALVKLQTRTAELERDEADLGTVVAVGGRVMISPSEQSVLLAVVNALISEAVTHTSLPVAAKAIECSFYSKKRSPCPDMTQLLDFQAELEEDAIKALEAGVVGLSLCVVAKLERHSALPWKLARFDCLRNTVRSQLDKHWRAGLPLAIMQLKSDLEVLGSHIRLNFISTSSAVTAALAAVNACLQSIVVGRLSSCPASLRAIDPADFSEDSVCAGTRLGIVSKIQHLRDVTEAIDRLGSPVASAAAAASTRFRM